MDYASYLRSALQTLLYLLVAPGVVGLLRWAKARLQGRQGPKPIQPYFDIWKLFHRRPVIPGTASWVFLAAPILIFAIYAFLGLLIPIFYLPRMDEIFSADQVSSPPLADFLIIIYLLGFSHFVFALAGMDTGSPFGGLGSSRKMFIGVISEPILILIGYALALNAHTTSLSGMMRFYADNIYQELLGNPSLWLILIALLLVILAEAERIPFDNPSTHLELTMVGKAISLEYAGPFLALIEWAEAMRLTFFMTLVLNLFLPFTLAASGEGPLTVALLAGSYLVKLSFLVICLAVWESMHARLRMRAIIGPAGIALVFSILAVIVSVAINYFI